MRDVAVLEIQANGEPHLARLKGLEVPILDPVGGLPAKWSRRPVMTTSSRLAASWCADTAGGIKNKMPAKK